MLSFYKKYYKTAFDIALLLLTVYLFMLLFSYIYRIAAPIFLAFIIFLIIEPLARLLHRRGLKKPMASAFSTLIFVLLVLAVLVGLGVIVASQILALKEIIPRYTALLQEQINYRIPDLQNRWASLPPDLVQQIKDYFASFTDNLSKIATYLLGAIYGFLTSFSGAIFSFAANFVIGIVLAYFLSTEIDFWKRSAAENTPRTFKTAYYFVKHNVLRGIIGYIKAQLKLVSITFAIVLAGLIILGVGNAFSLALLSAFFRYPAAAWRACHFRAVDRLSVHCRQYQYGGVSACAPGRRDGDEADPRAQNYRRHSRRIGLYNAVVHDRFAVLVRRLRLDHCSCADHYNQSSARTRILEEVDPPA